MEIILEKDYREYGFYQRNVFNSSSHLSSLPFLFDERELELYIPMSFWMLPSLFGAFSHLRLPNAEQYVPL